MGPAVPSPPRWPQYTVRKQDAQQRPAAPSPSAVVPRPGPSPPLDSVPLPGDKTRLSLKLVQGRLLGLVTEGADSKMIRCHRESRPCRANTLPHTFVSSAALALTVEHERTFSNRTEVDELALTSKCHGRPAPRADGGADGPLLGERCAAQQLGAHAQRRRRRGRDEVPA